MNMYYGGMKCPHCGSDEGLIVEYDTPEEVEPSSKVFTDVYMGGGEYITYFQQCNNCDKYVATTSKMHVTCVARKMTQEEIDSLGGDKYGKPYRV